MYFGQALYVFRSGSVRISVRLCTYFGQALYVFRSALLLLRCALRAHARCMRFINMLLFITLH